MNASAAVTLALPRWQRNAIYATVALVALSGLGWLLATWTDAETTSAATRSTATWLLRAHGIAAYGLLVAAGSVLPLHLRLGWRLGRNRWSGSALVGLLLVLAGSGLWLYYGPPDGRDAVSIAHWAVGLGLPVWLVLHRTWGLRSRRR